MPKFTRYVQTIIHISKYDAKTIFCYINTIFDDHCKQDVD